MSLPIPSSPMQASPSPLSSAGPSPSPSAPSSAGAGASSSAAAPGSEMEQFDEGFSALQQITLWESRTLMVLVGSDKTGRNCRLISIDRGSPTELRMHEEPTTYRTFAEAEARALHMIAASGAPLERTLRLAALLGIIRLPKLFLVCVVRRERVGSIGGRWLYSVAEWKLKAISHRSFDTRRIAALTARYKAMLLSDMDLSKDFYFSYFYDLTHTLQHNLLAWKQSKEEREEAAALRAEEMRRAAAAAYAAPEGRRRSVTHLGGPPPGPSSGDLQPMPTLVEEESLDEDALLQTRASTSAADNAPATSGSAAARPDPVSITSPPAGSAPAGGQSPQHSSGNSANEQQHFFNSGQFATATNASSESTASRGAPPTYNEQWLWNLHLAREFLQVLPHASYWLVPMIHGFVQQHAVRVGRKDVLVTLIARRSRHFAGTRYIKRGVSSLGHVANEVESEQIVCERHAFSEGMGAFSSVVMLRGSIPLYWAQENPKSPKPEIVVYNFDRDFVASKLHLSDCFARYGAPLAVLSLIKKEEKSPQETRLGMAFNHAIQRVQAQFRMDALKNALASTGTGAASSAFAEGSTSFQRELAQRDRVAALHADLARVGTAPFPTAGSPSTAHRLASAAGGEDFTSTRPPFSHPAYDPSAILYCTYDFLAQRARQANVLKDLRGLVSNLVEEIGVFCFRTRDASASSLSTAPLASADTSVVSVQRGVIRVNCIDCLDRTNVGQFCVGKAAIKIQLRALGIDEDSTVTGAAVLAGSGGDNSTALSVTSPTNAAGVTGGGVVVSGGGGGEVYPELVAILQDMYTQHGDRIAHQYAGSGAMHKEILYDHDDGGHGSNVDEGSIGSLESLDGGAPGNALSPSGGGGPSDALSPSSSFSAGPSAAGGAGGSAVGASPAKSDKGAVAAQQPSKNITQNALSAIKRYYSNNFSDADKQSAINVFLGNYIPTAKDNVAKPQIWELDVYTNLMDSDQLFGRGAGNFTLPFQPQALGFVQRRRAAQGGKRRGGQQQQSKLTAAALGSPVAQQQLNLPDPSTPFNAHSPSSSPSPVGGARSYGVPSSSSSDSRRFNQYFTEAYNPSTYDSFDEELKRAFTTPVLVKTAAMNFVVAPGAEYSTAQQTQSTQQQQQGTQSAGVQSSTSVGHGASPPVALPPITEAAEDDTSSKSQQRHAAISPEPASTAPAPSVAAAPASATSAAPATAAAAPAAAKTNPVKRGFASLFSNAKAAAKAGFSAAMNTGSKDKDEKPTAAGPASTATAAKPAAPVQPQRGAPPAVAAAAVRPGAAPATAAPSTGVLSLASLIQQQQSASGAPTTAPPPPSQPNSVPSSPTGAQHQQQQQHDFAQASRSGLAPLPPAHASAAQQSSSSLTSLSFSSSSSSSASASVTANGSPTSGAPTTFNSYPTSFQVVSTSSALYTGWSPRVSQKRVVPFAVPRMMPPAQGSAAGGESSADSQAAEELQALAIDGAYLHSAAEDARALDEYAQYCDTGRLADAPALPFAAPPLPSQPQAGVEHARLAALLGTAVRDAEVVSGEQGDEEATADDARDQEALTPTALLQAALRLPHHQLVSLLTDNLRDLTSLHAQLRSLRDAATAADIAEATAQPRRMRAAEPFVLDPIPAIPDAAQRRLENDRATYAMLGASVPTPAAVAAKQQA